MTPTLDVVIVSYNTRDDLDACLASVWAHPPAGLGTIFVVDNASHDGSPAHVRDRWPQVRLVALDQNAGFGAANNLALRASTATRVLLLNSDTVVPPKAIDRLVERLAATGAVAAGPQLVDSRGRPEISFGAMLSPWAELAQAVRVRLAAARHQLARAYVKRWVGAEREVDWVSGACLLVDRAAAVAAGLFDERYFMYEEDVDFCAALRARGGRIIFTPLATVTHYRGRSAAGASGAGGGGARPARQHYDRSHVAFYEKHAPHWAPLLRLALRLRGRPIG
ncbi:MAG: glycosyltransferase family 2 protein [Acidobacteriota bacterium]